jgi:uncharacterized protein YecT (DUF1311 family)
MFRGNDRCRQFLVVAATSIAVSCALATSVSGQATSGNLPTECSAYASVPLPAEAENVPTPRTSPACASYRSYRGLGRPVNYAEARACAWQERAAQKADLAQNPKEPTAWVVGGSLILADIYFNGAGIQRNVPLAMRFACEFEEGAAILALPDINKLNGALPAHGPFEFCDYGATTFTMNFCGGYESEIEGERRNRYYDSLKASMTSEQRAAFDPLLAAEHAYVETHDLEVDQEGSIREIRTLGSERILEDLFRAEIAHYERKDWPALSDSQIATADGLLQQAYEQTLQQLEKQSKDDIEGGAVTAENLRRVEKSWKAYRAAWTEFAHLRYPIAEAAIRAQITLDRYRLVKTIG